MSDKTFSYGGQAVLEGVMMRGRRLASVAVRRPDGSLALKHIPLPPSARAAWMHWPIIRGLVGLRSAFLVGKEALDFSAAVTSEEHEEDLSPVVQWIILVVALTVGIGLFVVGPSLIANYAAQRGAPVLVREIIEGLINLTLVILYIYAISRLSDIQRVFGYHGAEHKVINAYEAGVPLTVEAVRPFSRIHPRCGTSFLVIAAIIGFVIFLAVSGLPLLPRIGARIVLIPLVAAVAFEVMRFAAAHYHRPWVSRLLMPALSTQYLTTREPDDAMLATAIAALLPVLAADGAPVNETLETEQPLAQVVY
ncbi:DUF1385 domain-containing protein [Candidatus Chloroploca sp. M-50]|uniref:DUF1385 domain-containing protein n=1 Tax=Candidatus Chloroploca mongolica TaxID=2528176 RepID=A0ABS4D554_9CHLR|nr:DUF1385 domain-containing protein [Candidatus Chloroploca mongolica]MBP1464567.1 DUF1385 domain-containing protein [Candidatus Chloroploca mongolica]